MGERSIRTLHYRKVGTNNPTTTVPGLGWNQWHIHGGVLVGTRGLLVGLAHGHQSGNSPTRVPLVIVHRSAQQIAVVRLSVCTSQQQTICFAFPHKTQEYCAAIHIHVPPSSLVSAVLRNIGALHIAKIIKSFFRIYYYVWRTSVKLWQWYGALLARKRSYPEWVVHLQTPLPPDIIIMMMIIIIIMSFPRPRPEGILRENETWLHSFLSSEIDGRQWSSSRPGRFSPGKERLYPLNRRLGGPQKRSRRSWRREK